MNDYNKLNLEFSNVRKKGKLNLLRFFPKKKNYKKLLFVGGEKGDLVESTNELLSFAKTCENSRLENVLIDIVPVVDVNNYPHDRTILKEIDFGKKLYLDSGYYFDDRPEELNSLLEILGKGYDFATMFSDISNFEAPLINGHFVSSQMHSKDGLIKEFSPYNRDIVCGIIYQLKKNNLKLLDSKQKLGDNAIITMPGHVTKCFEEEYSPMHQFAYACMENNVPAVVMNSLKEDKPRLAHKIAMDVIVKAFNS